MFLTRKDPAAYFRTLLILGRTSNVPTVWSNCLAGWLLGGGGSIKRLLWLCFGATFLYVGGMFLNDAFDEDFDRQHRSERPIPSGAITANEVWTWGFTFLSIGTFSLVGMESSTFALTLCLTASILIYDAVHKVVHFAPVIMAACRFFLFLVAASTGFHGVTGTAIWSAFVLAGYIIGLSYLARRESARGSLSYWPLLVLISPLFMAWLVNDANYTRAFWIYGGIFVVWLTGCLRHTLGRNEPNIGYTVSGLLAGVTLVDLLAIAPASFGLAMVFIGLFIAALLLQRIVPAT